MSNIRTDYYYMTPDERRAYHRQKQQEYKERKAALHGRTIQHHEPGSHPTLMTREERLAYNRECIRRYKERHQLT